jgi:hypothetical protein
MLEDEAGPLDRLEAATAQIDTLATQVALGGKTLGPEVGARNRIELVKQRLKIALDALDGYPYTSDDITDE